MSQHVVLLSIPALRQRDLSKMPHLRELVAEGDQATLAASFPATTCPVQANMTTGQLPATHGVVANGFYWRDKHQAEMWTAWNEVIQAPQIWDVLREHDPAITSAVWFPLHSKGCGADYICTPAPIHNPDGSESLWCYTKPESLYGELRDTLGHFPLKHFWGPLASVDSSQWIADSAVHAVRQYRPNFFYVYLPHLDYAAQKNGPDSDQALSALGQLDQTIDSLVSGFQEAYEQADLLWLVASEYTIVPVDHVVYPNRVLREAGLLAVRQEADGEHLDLAASRAWAMADHQMSHVFVRERDAETIGRVAELFGNREGVAEVLTGEALAEVGLNHDRSGEVVLISTPNSWQAYYWWLDDAAAPGFARTVDIHRKPGYDPVELHFDPQAKGIPLDATLTKGSHGAPVYHPSQEGVLLSSRPNILQSAHHQDIDVAGLVLRQWIT